MLKRVGELSKDEKLLLLQAVANSDIDPKQYDQNTFVAIQRSDWFLSLQMKADNDEMKVISIHEAARVRKEFLTRQRKVVHS
jgi:hypothetical protein